MRTTPRLPSRPRLRAPLTVLVALTVVLAATTCGSSDPTASPDPTDVTKDSPETAALADRVSEAEEAYAQFWHVWTKANDPPNPDFADLTTVATGVQLDLLRNSIRENASKGVRFEEPQPSQRTHAFTVESSSAEQVVLRDCTVDDGISRDMATGAVINDSIATYLFKATLVLEGEAWKLADNERLGKWPGTTKCEQE